MQFHRWNSENQWGSQTQETFSETQHLPLKKFSSLQLFLASIGPIFCGCFSKINCRSCDAKCHLIGLDLNRVRNKSRWWRGRMEFMPDIVLQSQRRASDLLPDEMNDQISRSNSSRRDILCLQYSSFLVSSSQAGSRRNS